MMTTVNADFEDNLVSWLQCVQGKGLMSSPVWLSPVRGFGHGARTRALPTNCP